MTEYFTKALVLGQENSGESDKSVCLYAEDLGKVVARAKSARKITSKLAGQLEPLNFIRVRLIEKNGFQIVDALSFRKIKVSLPALELLNFTSEMTIELQPDRKLWLLLRKTFQELAAGKKFSYKPFLDILGFSPKFAECGACGGKFPAYFFPKEQIFLCRKCGLKFPKAGLILV